MIEYFYRFGIPKEILHDLGADLTSELFKEMYNSHLNCLKKCITILV